MDSSDGSNCDGDPNGNRVWVESFAGLVLLGAVFFSF
jgi:hypothetical protein